MSIQICTSYFKNGELGRVKLHIKTIWGGGVSVWRQHIYLSLSVSIITVIMSNVFFILSMNFVSIVTV